MSLRLVFGGPAIDIERITSAIAAFEETLVMPNSRFDQWLVGDAAAISEQEHAGYRAVQVERLRGVPQRTGRRRNHLPQDGRDAALSDGQPSGRARGGDRHYADRFNFKVPTIRNVALTYPYFHDGAAEHSRRRSK